MINPASQLKWGQSRVTGNRVEVLYAVPQNKTNNYATRASVARDKARKADLYLDDSTPNVDHHFRWLCDGAGEIIVRNVTIIEEGDNYTTDCVYENTNSTTEHFITMTDVYCSLQQQVSRGWGPVNYAAASGRIYLVFLDDDYVHTRLVDASNNVTWKKAAGMSTGSAGWTEPHSSPAVVTDGPGYAVAAKFLWDNGVTVEWTGKTALHEMGHTMGAVVNYVDSAGHNPPPTATAGAHCTDERDAMCYDDYDDGTNSIKLWNGSFTTLTFPCQGAEDWKFDCGKDTYYDPTPTQGEYLYSTNHVNVARNTFLQGFTTCATSC